MNNVIEEIKKKKLIAILRGVRSEKITETVSALLKGGINIVEITFDQSGKIPLEDTAAAIKKVASTFSDVFVGAGTVMTKENLELAEGAGAKFILSPDTNTEIIRKTKEKGLVSIPGAMTPSECSCAAAAGADFVKLFPAGNLGGDYLKAISSPLSNIPFLCVGGIDESNIPYFIKNGAAGFGIGSNLVNAKLVDSGNFEEITRRAGLFVNALNA